MYLYLLAFTMTAPAVIGVIAYTQPYITKKMAVISWVFYALCMTSALVIGLHMTNPEIWNESSFGELFVLIATTTPIVNGLAVGVGMRPRDERIIAPKISAPRTDREFKRAMRM